MLEDTCTLILRSCKGRLTRGTSDTRQQERGEGVERELNVYLDHGFGRVQNNLVQLETEGYHPLGADFHASIQLVLQLCEQ